MIERNRPDDTFGWGVVFSDQTLGNLRRRRRADGAQILDAFNHWDDIEVNIRGRTVRSGGHGFCGIGRKRAARYPAGALRRARRRAGVRDRRPEPTSDYPTPTWSSPATASTAASARSTPTTYQPDIDLRQCRFVWLGTHKRFEAFTFAFEETEYGWFQAHAYRFDAETSTFIVETPEDMWLQGGPGPHEKEESIAFCERLFAGYLDGHRLMSNAAHLRGSAQWIRFPRVVVQAGCTTTAAHRSC